MSGAAMSSPVRSVREVEQPVIDTARGKLRGVLSDGALVFKGIPYATAKRFMPPKPHKPWAGIRDAFAFGKNSPQPPSDNYQVPWKAWFTDHLPQSEDCQVLNVYAPAEKSSRKRPVMVFLHGGGFSIGSAAAAGYDGTRLARDGDVVVVTINHRLNVFGFLYLAELAGAEYADSGNVGMMDAVGALLWVRENIAAFGGDAGNVTIFGQSGGGTKVACLMASPDAKGLFHKAIIQSASSLIRLSTQDASTEGARELCKEAGVAAAKLKDLPMDALLKARRAVVERLGREDFYHPVVDGRFVPAHPFDPSAPEFSRDVPLLIGTTETEQTFTLSNDERNFTLDKAEVLGRIQRFMGTTSEQASQLYDDYAVSRTEPSPSDILFGVLSDQMYRRNDTLAADLKVAQNGAPVYFYQITWKCSTFGGLMKSPHTTCIPFIFGTYEEASLMLGTGADRAGMSKKMMGAWTSFARTGVPSAPGLPDWTRYNSETRPTMILDNDSRVVNDPRWSDRVALDRYPLYTPASAKRR